MQFVAEKQSQQHIVRPKHAVVVEKNAKNMLSSPTHITTPLHLHKYTITSTKIHYNNNGQQTMKNDKDINKQTCSGADDRQNTNIQNVSNVKFLQDRRELFNDSQNGPEAGSQSSMGLFGQKRQQKNDDDVVYRSVESKSFITHKSRYGECPNVGEMHKHSKTSRLHGKIAPNKFECSAQCQSTHIHLILASLMLLF